MVFLLHYLRSGDLFVDVGANAGSYALLAASRGAFVVAAEPNPLPRRYLQRSIESNGFEVELVDKAISDKAGSAHMDCRHDATASIVPADVPGALKVETITLDQMVAGRRVKLLKIDVEGAEPQVLAGGETTLRNTEAMLIETWGKSETHRLVEDHGFIAVSYDPRERRLERWKSSGHTQNVLFVKRLDFVAAEVCTSAPIRVGRQTF